MKKPRYVSHSQIATYQQCALKYHYKYRTTIKGKRDEEAAPALNNGTKVHKAIELLIKGEEEEYINLRLDKVQRAMFAQWKASCLPDLPDFKYIESEKRLVGLWKQWNLQGYLDMLWFEDDGATAYIGDIKTGNVLFFPA